MKHRRVAPTLLSVLLVAPADAFALDFLAPLLNITAPVTVYQSNLLTYHDAGAEKVAADPATFPIQLDPQFNQNSVHMLAPDPTEITITLPSIDEEVPNRLPKGTSATPTPPPVTCKSSEHTLLLDGHTVVRNVRWRKGDGSSGCGTAIPHRLTAGHFWFIDSQSLDLSCKALRRPAVFWLACAGLTNTVEVWIDAVNNANPSIQKQYYSPIGKLVSFFDNRALQVGPNTSPQFSTLNCGSTFEVDKGTSGTLSVFVKDNQNDNIVGTVRILKGGNAVTLDPQWVNPVSGAGTYLQTIVAFPEVGDYIIGVEAKDTLSLIPTLCTIGVKVK